MAITLNDLTTGSGKIKFTPVLNDDGTATVTISTTSTYYGFRIGFTLLTGGKYYTAPYVDYTGTDGQLHTHYITRDEMTDNEYTPCQTFTCVLPFCDDTTVINLYGYHNNYEYLRHMYFDSIDDVESTILNIIKMQWTGGSSGLQTNITKIVLTCADGFKFVGDVKGEYKTGTFPYQNKEITFDVDETGTIATYTGDANLKDFAPAYGVCMTECKVSDGSTPETKTVTLANNITDSTASVTYDETNDTFTVDVSCATGFTFENAQVTYIDETGTEKAELLTVTDNTGTVTIHAQDKSTVTLTGNVITPPVTITVNKVLSDCTFVGLDTVTKGNPYICRVETTFGNVFADVDVPYIQYTNEFGEFKKQYGTLNEDKTICNISFDTSLNNSTYITVYASAHPVKNVGDDYGAINIYSVTKDIIQTVTAKRYFKNTVDTAKQYITVYQDIDLGQYINSIRRFYFNVPTNATGTIYCGNYSTETTGGLPTDTVFTFDFGDIPLQGINNTCTDYLGEITLYLPFVGFKNVPVDYMNKTVNVTYKVDIVNGFGVVLLSCDGVVFDEITCTPCKELIYKTWNDTDVTTVGELDRVNPLLSGLEPFVILKQYRETTGNNNDKKNVTVGDMVGYCRFDELSTGEQTTGYCKPIKTEYDEICNLLQQGVYM